PPLYCLLLLLALPPIPQTDRTSHLPGGRRARVGCEPLQPLPLPLRSSTPIHNPRHFPSRHQSSDPIDHIASLYLVLFAALISENSSAGCDYASWATLKQEAVVFL
ncbi:unnamed protein product, partial [Urochloa humidicola]